MTRPHPKAPGTVGLVRVLLLFESSLYAAVTPVLPHYARVLGISKPAVGVLAAAYTFGLLPGSLLGGWAASRLGVRRTTIIGLTGFAFAVAGFGFATSLLALDTLRFVQGIACGFIWGGALTWVIAVTPRARRGATLGSVIGAATLGTLIGPLLGTLAVATSTGLVFSLVGVVSLALAVWVHAHPEDAPAVQDEVRPANRPRLTLRTAQGLILGAWLIMLEAMTFGAINALLPLRLARFGGSGLLIGAAFLGASAVSFLLSTPVGRLTDRHGPRRPLAVGLVLSAILIPALVIPHGAIALAILSVVAVGGPMTGCMTPAVSVMTASTERLGIALIVASTLFNLAYAAGETIGAPLAAVISQATSDAVPLIGLGVLMLISIIPAVGLAVTDRPGTAAPAGAVDDASGHEPDTQRQVLTASRP